MAGMVDWRRSPTAGQVESRRCEDGRLGYADEMTRPLTSLLVMGLTCAAAGGSAYGKGTCAKVRGWELAREQKPSPVPYSEPIHNAVVQLDNGRWKWNGSNISDVTLFMYLRQVSLMSPAPLTLIQFSSNFDCAAKRVLKARIGNAAGCEQQAKPCLEGTSAEYRRSRRLP